MIRFEAQHIDDVGAIAFLGDAGYKSIRFKANGVGEILAVLVHPGGRNATGPLPVLECSVDARNRA